MLRPTPLPKPAAPRRRRRRRGGDRLAAPVEPCRRGARLAAGRFGARPRPASSSSQTYIVSNAGSTAPTTFCSPQRRRGRGRRVAFASTTRATARRATNSSPTSAHAHLWMFAQGALVVLAFVDARPQVVRARAARAARRPRSKLEFVASMAELQQRARPAASPSRTSTQPRAARWRATRASRGAGRAEIAERVRALRQGSPHSWKRFARLRAAVAGAQLSPRAALELPASASANSNATLGILMRSREIRQRDEEIFDF